MRLTVEYYRDSANEWRWRARAGNHEVVADSGEGYQNREDCTDMAEALFSGRNEVEYVGR